VGEGGRKSGRCKFQEDLVATLGRMGVDSTAEAASFSRTNSSTRVHAL